jgi:GyrI-like small molecule binding domain
LGEQPTEAPEPTLVERDDLTVMFLRAAADEPEPIGDAWNELERLVGTRGRKFFGTFDPATGEYRACTTSLEGDEAAALGLDVGTLPGGRYLRVRLRGEPPAVYELISPTFKELAKHADVDPSRPSIEFYRRRDEIDLLLPLA